MARIRYNLIRAGTIGLTCLLCCCFLTTRGQFFELESAKSTTLPFQLIRNLVVIKLKIDNKGPYNFVLDTGVGFMLITEPSLADSIKMDGIRTIKMSGLGEGDDFGAYVTPMLKVDIPGLVSHNIRAAILKKDHFSLSSYAGIPIHGLLGYEFFNRLAVKISFSDSTITVAAPKNMRYFKNGSTLPITIEGGKPYLTTNITYADDENISSKLIVDLGAGHFLSMENVANKNCLQNKFIRASLGMGIKGLINGSLSRVKSIDLGKYKVKNVITAFPDDNNQELSVPRDGNIGISLLKKFDIIFDYPNSLIYLKPAQGFGTADEHDMSGLWYYSVGDNFDHLIINKVEPGSAADDIGLEKDDEITAINFRPVSKMTLQQIDEILKSGDGRALVIEIYRDKKYYRLPLILKRRI